MPAAKRTKGKKQTLPSHKTNASRSAATNIKKVRETWQAEFKKAIRSGQKPEKDLFEGLMNDFDKTEW